MENENSVLKLINDESFCNWAKGLATQDEAASWDRWITLSLENRDLAMEAQKRLLGFSLRKKSGTRAATAWQDLEKGMSRPNPDVNKPGWVASDYPSVVHASKKRSEIQRVARVAAIIVVMAGGGYLWSIYTDTTVAGNESLMQEEIVYQTIETDYGEQKEMQLFDGTQIILNANSSMRYARSFSNSSRIDIELEGEAFFSVPSRGHNRFEDEDDIFQVSTKDGVVRVLGTRFSVSSHNDKTVVVLEEGSLAVATGKSAVDTGEAGAEQWILYPNELAEFSRESGGLIKKEIVDTRMYTSWKDSRLFFDNMPVRDVIRRFEYTFGVPFKVNEPSLLDRTVSGSVENSELEVMAQIFAEMLNVSVDVSDEQVLIKN